MFVKDSPDTPHNEGLPEAVNRHREETPPVFSPPPGARFFIGADFDGNDASYISVPGSRPGYFRSLARDGSPATRLTSAGAREVSREEFEASAAYVEQPSTKDRSESQTLLSSELPSFMAFESENGEAAVVSSDFAMRKSADGSWKPGGFSAVEGMERFARVTDSAKAMALFKAAEAAQLRTNPLVTAKLDGDMKSIFARNHFPADAEFWLKESDVPLVHTREGWFNWFGGNPKQYDASRLRVDNSEEVNFEVFAKAVEASRAFARITSATKSVPVNTDPLGSKDLIPSPESLTQETLEKWERAPSWGMVWDRFLSSSPATLLSWLDKGPLNLRRNLAVKAMELSRVWADMPSMPGPEGLVEAFQRLYPATDSVEPNLSDANAQRLAEFFDSLNT
jgi:hypothetical protein